MELFLYKIIEINALCFKWLFELYFIFLAILLDLLIAFCCISSQLLKKSMDCLTIKDFKGFVN